MELFAASGLINAITAISFGMLVILKNWRERSNQLFFLMTLALAIWGFGYWEWLSTTDYDAAIVWVKILSVGSLFIPTFFFHWVVSVLGQEKLHRVLLILSHLSAIAIAFTVRTDLFISGVGKKFIFDYWPSAGLAYSVYFSYIYIGLILYTFYLLVRFYYLIAEPNKKGQILYILLGALLGFGGGLTNFPLWYGIAVYPYGNFLVAAFPFLLGYSVLKYKLFNAKVIATEILVFFITIILFTQALLSQSAIEFVLRGFLATLVAVFGYLLIRSVYREVSQREKIEKLSEEKSEFMSFASHQIKGPLTEFKIATSMILDGDFGEVSPELKNIVQDLYSSADHAVPMVQGFLDASKLEQEGGMTYNMAEVDMRKIVDEVVKGEKIVAEKKGLILNYSVAPNDNFKINADAIKIKQVVFNLIDNAIKYTPSGNIIVSLEHLEKVIRFSVKDSGIGIVKEDMAKIFAKFGRGKDATKVNVSSNGLGLYLAKEFVDAHHGKIWVESEGPGKGSTFVVELGLV